MERSRKVIFISHCILNQNAKAIGREKAPGSVKDLVDLLADSEIGIIQLPCPQIEFNDGLHRKPKTKEQYDKKEYRNSCRKLSISLLNQIENYMSKNYKIVGILGVEFTPTCAVHQLENSGKVAPGKGIFIEELEALMKKKRFQVPIIGVNLNNIYSTVEKVQSLVECS